jgi:NAD(P)-dependent dehydrogenase (short-subunit alcohol dehydrogenase family)
MGVLVGKVALVTRASRGFGAVIPKSLAAEGAAVIIPFAAFILTRARHRDVNGGVIDT